MEVETQLAVSSRSWLFLPITSSSRVVTVVQALGTGLTSLVPSSICIFSNSTWRLEGGPEDCDTVVAAGAPPVVASPGWELGVAQTQQRLRTHLGMSPAKEELRWGRGGRGGE